MHRLPEFISCRHCRNPFDIGGAELCLNCRTPALVCTECGRCSYASIGRKGSCVGTWAGSGGRDERRQVLVRGEDPSEVVDRLVIISDSPEIQSFAASLLELFGFVFDAERGGMTAMKRSGASIDPVPADSILFTGREVHRILHEDLGEDCPVIVMMMSTGLDNDRIDVMGGSVVDVFSHEEMDAATARWFLEMALFGDEPCS